MDVFFSHNSQDKEVVESIASWMTDRGIKVWLDKWMLKPGDSLILLLFFMFFIRVIQLI